MPHWLLFLITTNPRNEAWWRTLQKNIVAIKEASGDISFDEKIKSAVSPEFTLLSGDDPTYLPFLKLGGAGIISVMSNAIPDACARWIGLARQNKWAEAQLDFDTYKQLIALMYIEANPIPIKWMLFKMGLISSPEMRLPLVELDKAHFENISAEMKKTGLI